MVYREGCRFYGSNFVLIYRPNGTRRNRLGISIHRTLKGAVKRNRIKRVIRECFRLHRQIFPLEADIVFAVRYGFSLDSPEMIRLAVESIQHGSSGKVDE